jgi:hypothetical protein
LGWVEYTKKAIVRQGILAQVLGFVWGLFRWILGVGVDSGHFQRSGGACQAVLRLSSSRPIFLIFTAEGDQLRAVEQESQQGGIELSDKRDEGLDYDGAVADRGAGSWGQSPGIHHSRDVRPPAISRPISRFVVFDLSLRRSQLFLALLSFRLLSHRIDGSPEGTIEKRYIQFSKNEAGSERVLPFLFGANELRADIKR